MKHQEDKVEENVLERVVPIVDDDVHHQENVPVQVDMSAEANSSDLDDSIVDVVKHQESTIEENVLEKEQTTSRSLM